MKTVPAGVVCYWEYEKGDCPDDLPVHVWVLKESYPTDEYGFPTVPTSTSHVGRNEYYGWTNEMRGDDLVPIMGRAVTYWDVEYGVSLLDFHPPAWSDWVSSSLVEKLRGRPDWDEFLECGFPLRKGTVSAVIHLLTKE